MALRGHTEPENIIMLCVRKCFAELLKFFKEKSTSTKVYWSDVTPVALVILSKTMQVAAIKFVGFSSVLLFVYLVDS